MGELYTYIIRGAFGVARFDNPGNARAYTQWNEQKVRLHVFRFVTYIKLMYNISFEAKD